jgi:hypothetical protein
VSETRHRPAVSDIALALATRRSDPVSKVELSLNAKGDVQIAVDVNDPDPAKAAQVASDLFDVLRAKYPRENGDAREPAKTRATK